MLKIKTRKYFLEKGLEVISIMATLIGGLIGYSIGILFGWINLIFLGLYIAVLWFTYKYLKKRKIYEFLVAIIAWSNALTWFYPPLGIFIGVITTSLIHNTEQKNQKKYKILAVIGITLTIINIAIGVYQGFMKPI